MATHQTQDPDFLSRKHIEHLKHWNENEIKEIGWDILKTKIYALVKFDSQIFTAKEAAEYKAKRAIIRGLES